MESKKENACFQNPHIELSPMLSASYMSCQGMLFDMNEREYPCGVGYGGWLVNLNMCISAPR